MKTDYANVAHDLIRRIAETGVFREDERWTLIIDAESALDAGTYLAENTDDQTFLDMFSGGDDATTALLRQIMTGAGFPSTLLAHVGRDWLVRYAKEIQDQKAVDERIRGQQ